MSLRKKCSYAGPHFPAFALKKEKYSVSLRIQSEFGKMLTKITPNTDTFHAVCRKVFYTINNIVGIKCLIPCNFFLLTSLLWRQ